MKDIDIEREREVYLCVSLAIVVLINTIDEMKEQGLGELLNGLFGLKQAIQDLVDTLIPKFVSRAISNSVWDGALKATTAISILTANCKLIFKAVHNGEDVPLENCWNYFHKLIPSLKRLSNDMENSRTHLAALNIGEVAYCTGISWDNFTTTSEEVAKGLLLELKKFRVEHGMS